MARTSPCFYISPTAISVTPNANGSASDLAINVVKGTKIKVYSQGISALGYSDASFQQWTLAGRNRRLSDSTKPYTIYARLAKNNKEDGYLVFAPKVADGNEWLDKYAYVTISGLATDTANKDSGDYWYIKLGDVSLPVDNARTVTIDTGILGTDQFNIEWNLDPDQLPLRIELTATIESKDAGDKPYVEWGKELILQARLLEGWANANVQRFHHFTIQRNTGDPTSDTDYNYPGDNSDAEKPPLGRQMPNGNIVLSHARGVGDVFNGTVSSTWTVIAWGVKTDAGDSSSSGSASSKSVSSESVSSSDGSTNDVVVENYEKLTEKSINIMAETAEQYSLELSSSVVSYDPSSDTYNPIEGIDVMVRATDQRGEVFKLTNAQLQVASLVVQYSVVSLDQWNDCYFTSGDAVVAEANIPIEAFHLQQNVNVRIVKVQVASASSSASSSSSSSATSTTTYKEVYRSQIALVRNGEDSKEREWIFLRSTSALYFADTADDKHKLLPSLVTSGEVRPVEVANGVDANKNQDGWVPEGWWDDSLGTDKTYHYEYTAYRDYIKSGRDSSSSKSDSSSSESSSSGDAVQRGGYWGDFSTPFIWSYYAEDAVSYRCRWTLAGSEVYQLKCAYTGAFRGTLPLVATLMKRVGNGQEQEVNGETVIVLACEGIDYTKTFNAEKPTFSISASDSNTAEFVQHLNSVALASLSVSFTVEGEMHKFSIPVIREADEDSVKETIKEYGDKKYLSKITDDTAQGVITFVKGLIAEMVAKLNGGATFGNNGYKFDKDGNVVVDAISSLAFDEALERGFGISKNAHGKYTLSVTDLIVWGKAVFNSLEIRKLYSVGGNVYLSGASSKLQHVVPVTDADGEVTGWKCYILSDDGTTATQNGWVKYDQAKCQTFDIQEGTYEGVSNTFYWRLVTDVSAESEVITGTATETYTDDDGNEQTREVTVELYDGKKFGWIVLSKSDCEDTTNDEPKAGDTIVLDGHRMFASGDAEGRDQYNDESRTNVMMLETTGVSGDSLPRIVALTGITDYKHSDGTNEYSNTVFILSPKDVVFVSSCIKWISASGDPITFVNFRGSWTEGTAYSYYDQVSYDNAIWTCIVEKGTTTTEEPNDTSKAWRKEISGGKGEKGDGYGVSLALEQRTISSVTDDCLVVRFIKTGADGVTTTENIADFEGYAQLLVDGKASEAATTRLNLDTTDAGTLSKSAFPDLFAASYITVKWFDYQGGTLLATASLTRGADGEAAETYEMMVSEYSEYTCGGRVYGLQFQFAKVTGTTRQTVTDITQIGCHVAINTSRYVYTSAAAYVNEGHDHFLFSSYPVNSVTMDEADNITVKMYLDTDTDNENPVAAVNYANGKQGTSALEIMVNPETLVFDTEDTGLVASGTTKSATISCYRDGVDVTSGCTLTLMTGTSYMVNCSASLSGNTLTVNSVTSQTVTVDGTSQTVSQTNGYATVQVYDPTSRLNHYVQVPFTVNIAKFTGGLKADNKKLQSQYSELTNDGSIKDLTQYKSEILQTAREISLHVSEKNVGRRNLLVGSALRKQGEGVQIAIVKDGDGIQMVGGYEGTNCLKVTAYSGQYRGLFWRATDNGVQNVKIKRNAKYTASVWVKTDWSDTSNNTVEIEAIYKASATAQTRLTRPTFTRAYPTKVAGTWQLYTALIQTGADYDYMECNFWVVGPSSGSRTAWFCRPMLEEGSEYLGWTLSERDYDYIGGNLLDNTGTLAKGGNLSSVNEKAVTQNGMGESAAIHKAMRALAGRVSTKTSLPTSASHGDLYACTDTWLLWQYTGTTLTDNEHYNGFTLVDNGEEMLHNDFLTFSLSDLDDNGDYMVSWYAKGNALVGCYVAGSSDHKVTIECSDGYTWNGGSAMYGEHEMQLANNWTRYWVHVRKTAGTVTGLYFRQYRNEDNTASEAYFSQPKLEVGATMTEWTEKRSDMVDKQALLATGIDIDSKKITLTANTTVFQDNDGNETAVIDTEGLRASKIATTDTGNGHTVISGNSTIWFQKDGVTPGIAVFYDAAGVPHFQFYGSDGAVKYDFGPSGLQSFISSTQQAYSDTAYLRAVSSKVSTSGSTLSFAWVYVKSKQDADLCYIWRKQIPTTDTSSAYEIYDGCVFTKKYYNTANSANWPSSSYLLADGWYVEPNDGQLPMKLHMAEEEAVCDPTKTVYYQTFYYYSGGKVSRVVKAYMMRDTNTSALADKFYYTGEYEEV